MIFHNKINKKELKEKLKQDSTKRITLSFYKYVVIDNPQALRDDLYVNWSKINILGRIHIAREGINAQMSLPSENWDVFSDWIHASERFNDIKLNFAIEDHGKSFYKLTIKVKKKIVADGLKDNEFDVTNVGKHLSAQEFNEEMDNHNAIVVDMRNHYESEVGHFKNAVCPDADTFKQELPMVLEMLKDKKNKKILLYCTGGIRCEKASAYLKHYGFKDVNQLYGGIISYTRQIREKGLESKFIGKNFVFDERLGERITHDIISECHQCGSPCDSHVNCANDDCHLLFIQCEKCNAKFNGCCTLKCQEIVNLPIEMQRTLRKGKNKRNSHSVYKSRLRPKLNVNISKV